jgi:hypothetical protein
MIVAYSVSNLIISPRVKSDLNLKFVVDVEIKPSTIDP